MCIIHTTKCYRIYKTVYKLEAFEIRIRRRMIKISWVDRILWMEEWLENYKRHGRLQMLEDLYENNTKF